MVGRWRNRLRNGSHGTHRMPALVVVVDGAALGHVARVNVVRVNDVVHLQSRELSGLNRVNGGRGNTSRGAHRSDVGEETHGRHTLDFHCTHQDSVDEV